MISGEDGTLTVPALAAASYYVAAGRSTHDDGDDAWQEPAYLEKPIADATNVRVAEGQARTVTRRVH